MAVRLLNHLLTGALIFTTLYHNTATVNTASLLQNFCNDFGKHVDTKPLLPGKTTAACVEYVNNHVGGKRERRVPTTESPAPANTTIIRPINDTSRGNPKNATPAYTPIPPRSAKTGCNSTQPPPYQSPDSDNDDCPWDSCDSDTAAMLHAPSIFQHPLCLRLIHVVGVIITVGLIALGSLIFSYAIGHTQATATAHRVRDAQNSTATAFARQQELAHDQVRDILRMIAPQHIYPPPPLNTNSTAEQRVRNTTDMNAISPSSPAVLPDGANGYTSDPPMNDKPTHHTGAIPKTKTSKK